jgi:threonine/homoserine/homoserine lactone efflux protein
MMLPTTMFVPLMTYTVVNSFTPGPNNIMLMASGVNFGFRRTLPHILGVIVGFALLVSAVGFGLGTLFSKFPQFQIALKVVGVTYLLWLAWKTANAGHIHSGDAEPTPLTMFEAIAFQAVNPKAWFMAVSAMSLYVRPGHLLGDVGSVTAVLVALNVLSANTCAAFGTALREALQNPVRVRIFNIVMALALAASILPMLAV